MDQIITLMAGCAAEIVVFGEASNGAGLSRDSDLAQEAALALKLDTEWGFHTFGDQPTEDGDGHVATSDECDALNSSEPGDDGGPDRLELVHLHEGLRCLSKADLLSHQLRRVQSATRHHVQHRTVAMRLHRMRAENFNFLPNDFGHRDRGSSVLNCKKRTDGLVGAQNGHNMQDKAFQLGNDGQNKSTAQALNPELELKFDLDHLP